MQCFNADRDQTIARNIGFSPKVERCLAHRTRHAPNLEKSDWHQINPVIDKLRADMTLARDDVIERVLSRNPDVVRIVRTTNESGSIRGLIALLPLNEIGVKSLVEGEFDGLDPDIDAICTAGETPAAIYLWLVYMPGILARLLPAIVDHIAETVPHGCAIFTRTTNAHARRLSLAMGFTIAREFYRCCGADILVIHPQNNPCNKHSAKYDIKIARNFDDINQIFSIRSIAYIAAQPCYYSEEFDGNDFCATHMLAAIDGEPAGCIRMRFFSSFAKLERLAVRPEYRRSRLAYMLARAAISHCQKKGYSKLYGHARADLVRFWQIFGFRCRADRPEFSFASIKYREMELSCAPDKSAINLDHDPMTLIRPEGDWDRAGPLDRSLSEKNRYMNSTHSIKLRTIFGQNINRQINIP